MIWVSQPVYLVKITVTNLRASGSDAENNVMSPSKPEKICPFVKIIEILLAVHMLHQNSTSWARHHQADRRSQNVSICAPSLPAFQHTGAMRVIASCLDAADAVSLNLVGIPSVWLSEADGVRQAQQMQQPGQVYPQRGYYLTIVLLLFCP